MKARILSLVRHWSYLHHLRNGWLLKPSPILALHDQANKLVNLQINVVFVRFGKREQLPINLV